MQWRAKRTTSLCLPAMCIAMLLFSACENSLSDIKKIAIKESEKPISRSTGVDVIYSDSSKVKARLQAPLMIDYNDDKKPYREMPKGVKVVFYDDNLKQKGTITAEYAIQRERENIIEFRKNVVAINAEGEIFKSDELIYDQNAKKLSSSKPVEIMMTNGDIMDGTGFHSNESLFPWNIDHTTGIFHVTQKQDPFNQ